MPSCEKDFSALEIMDCDQKSKVKPVRIYPLLTEDFSDMCDTKRYFKDGLKEEYGKFYYRNCPIVAETGTIVLFQYEQHIIAQAELLKVCKLEEPIIAHNIKYNGYFLFDLDTVHYYNEALPAEEFCKIYPDKPLSRVKHVLDDEEKNIFLLQKCRMYQTTMQREIIA